MGQFGAVPGLTVPAVQQCARMNQSTGYESVQEEIKSGRQHHRHQRRYSEEKYEGEEKDKDEESAHTIRHEISEAEVQAQAREQMYQTFVSELIRRQQVSGTFEMTEGTIKPFEHYMDNDPVVAWNKKERSRDLAKKKWDAEADCEYLRAAMKGPGTNDDAIIEVVGTRCNTQHQELKKCFKLLYGRNLIQDLKSELSGDYKELVMALFVPPAEFDAWCVKEAIYGQGTDEMALIEILMTRTNAQMKEICMAYPSVLNDRYHGKEPVIKKNIREDTSGDFKRLLISAVQGDRYEIPREQLEAAMEEIMNPETKEGIGMFQVNYAKLCDMEQAKREAQQLNKAGEERWGTDEETFNRIFSTRDYYQLRATWNEYVMVQQSRTMAGNTLAIPAADGFVKPGFEHVQDVFRQSIEEGIEQGGSFAAYFEGELVVNLWGGFADEDVRRPWRHSTASAFYSSTKSPSAVVIGHLVDKGILDYEEPISKWWPEFGQNGKDKITLKHLVSLKAGVSLLTDTYPLALIRDDPEHLAQILAQQTPWQTGNDCFAYSPITIGLYLDQIVRRVDPLKRNLSQYFQEEIADPFGIDFHIGMQKPEQWRVARAKGTVTRLAYKKFLQQQAANPNVDINLALLAQSQPSDFLRNGVFNDPDFLALPVGSSHGVGTAAGMAKLHGILANDGRLGGQQLLSPQILQLMQTPLSMGAEKVYGQEMFYSYGMTLLPVLESSKVKYNFGHGGFGGQFAACDVQHKTGWAYLTNYLDPTVIATGNGKWKRLEQALFKCVQMLKGVNLPRRHILTARDLQDTLQNLKSRL